MNNADVTKPTPAQLVVLNTVRMLRQKHSYGPTVGEVAKAMKMHKETVNSHLRALRAKGYLKVAQGGYGFIPTESA